MSVAFVEFLLPLLLIFGLILLVRGLRGRKIDDHPLCRRCGFDLIGLPEGAGRCSECGTDLHAPNAIRHGHRQRRVGLIASGAAMLSVVVLFVIVAIYAAATNTNWQQYKPAWWLIRETASGDVKIREDALAELSARLWAGSLSQEQIDSLADRALAIQADLSKPWSGRWGDFVESANIAGKLSNERWTKYLVQAPQLKLEIRPEVRRGDRIPYWIREPNARVGNKSQLYANHKCKEWAIGPVTRTDHIGSGTMLSLHGGGATGSSIQLKTDELDRLPDGENELSIKVELGIGKSRTMPPMATKQVELKSSFVLRPATQPTAKLVADESVRAAVEKSLTCQNATYGQSWNAKHLNVTVSVSGNPVALGFDVYAVIKGKEVKLGAFACPAGKTGHAWGMGAEVSPFDDATIDLVLKPNLKAALGTTDTFEVWDGVMTIKDVPVKHATTERATTRGTK